MNSVPAKVFVAALAVAGCALTSCVVPVDPYYGGTVYDGGYAPYYGPGYGYGGYQFVETGRVAVLPVGATYVYEYGEPHWYYRGTCYRRGSNGYVIVSKKPSSHHYTQSSNQHSSNQHSNPRVVYQTPNRSNRYVVEQKKAVTNSQSTLNRENRYGSSEDSKDDDHKSSGHHSGHSSKKDSGHSGDSDKSDRKGR